jgi:hypothetical protein
MKVRFSYFSTDNFLFPGIGTKNMRVAFLYLKEDILITRISVELFLLF